MFYHKKTLISPPRPARLTAQSINLEKEQIKLRVDAERKDLSPREHYHPISQ